MTYFQAALGGDVTASTTTTPQPQSHTDTVSDSDSEETILSANLDDIIGNCYLDFLLLRFTQILKYDDKMMA